MMWMLVLSLIAVAFSLVENAYIRNNTTQDNVFNELKQKMEADFDRIYTYSKHDDTPHDSETSGQDAVNEVDIHSNDKRSNGIPAGRWTCNTGMAWKELGNDYHPRFLKEVVCNQTTCVLGFFSCQPYYYQVRVLSRRRDNEEIDLNIPRALRIEWKFSIVDLAVGCECGRAD